MQEVYFKKYGAICCSTQVIILVLNQKALICGFLFLFLAKEAG